MTDVMVSGTGSELVLAQSTLISLLERAFPDPDHPLPHGPGDPVLGPVPDPWRLAIAGVLGRLDWAMLNPQPLPPKERGIVAARVMIAQAVSTFEMAEVVAADGGEQALGVIDSRISRFLDDFCGTPPHPPKPWPHPWGGIYDGSEVVQPEEQLAASVQFQKAADAHHGYALYAPFQNAADKSREAGLQGLAEG
jgi:hypothetical protein